MTQATWNDVRLPPGSDGPAWELFHENSKTDPYKSFLSNQEIVARMGQLWESLPFAGYPVVELPGSLTPLRLSLEEAILTRATARGMAPGPLSLENLRTLLHCAYGLTRDNRDAGFPRPFRTVPSAGALYPLDIFLHSAHVVGLRPGLYHYNPTGNNLRLLREGDQTDAISKAVVYTNVPRDASVVFFITALFERSTFKYGERGYRFVLLEAGHVAQNINLVSNGLGLGCLNLGGFFDRRVDEFLDLDGLAQSTIYMAAVGKRLGEPPGGAVPS